MNVLIASPLLVRLTFYSTARASLTTMLSSLGEHEKGQFNKYVRNVIQRENKSSVIDNDSVRHQS